MSRLLPLLYLLLLSQAALSQQAGTATMNEVPNSCPVTKPYQTSLFVPPSPYESNAGAGTFWFGTDRLWTNLPANGTWRLGHYTPSDPTFSQKLFWWRQGYDWRTEPQPNLKVTGTLCDQGGSARRDFLLFFTVVSRSIPTAEVEHKVGDKQASGEGCSASVP